MSELAAFNSVWSRARETYGSGTPSDGAEFNSSSQSLSQASDTTASAAPGNDWTGAASTSYAGANDNQGRRLSALSDLDQRVGEQMQRSADVVTTGRDNLDNVRTWVDDMASSVPDSKLREQILAQITRKGAADVEAIMQQSNSDLSDIADRLKTIKEEYGHLDEDKTDGDEKKDEKDDGAQSPAAEPEITQSGTEVTVNTGDEDDTVSVTTDSETGEVVVTANGVSERFPPAQAQTVNINTNGGNDTINVQQGLPVNLRVEAGAGNDRVKGGSGRDYINGSTGEDTIDGRGGDDVIYGGDGNDTLYGQAGNDYLEGGAGNDLIYGEGGNDAGITTGNDIISGGLGDDELYSGVGDDKVYTGDGVDFVSNSAGYDTVYAQVGTDTVSERAPVNGSNTVVNVVLQDLPDQIVIEGTPEFQERVRADLEFYRSSPTGQGMLSGLVEPLQDGETVRIVETDEWNGRALATDNPTIEYNPQFSLNEGLPTQAPPSVTLFHEMAHAYDYTHNDDYRHRGEDINYGPNYNGVDRVDHGYYVLERQAVGLPIDHDNNPDTPEIIAPWHPVEVTENAIREELGLTRREHYGS